jgi:hypothetical protein
VQDIEGKCRIVWKLQDSAGKFRTVQESGGQYRKCRTVQEIAGQYRKFQDSTGKCRKSHVALLLPALNPRQVLPGEVLVYSRLHTWGRDLIS